MLGCCLGAYEERRVTRDEDCFGTAGGGNDKVMGLFSECVACLRVFSMCFFLVRDGWVVDPGREEVGVGR